MKYIEQIKKYNPTNEQEESDKKLILQLIETFGDNILTRENNVAHITSSSIIVNEDISKMVMVHHNIYNTWTWTGGHADWDEDLLEIALKEAKEETWISNLEILSEDILSIDIFSVQWHIKKGKYVSTHLHLSSAYIFIADENDKLKINKDENSGVKWVDLDELALYSDEPVFLIVYEKLIKKAKQIKESKKNIS